MSAARGSKRRVLSIRLIVTAAAVLLTTTAVLSVGAISERQAREALTREIEARLLLQARNLALTSSQALLGEDYPELTLQPLVREMLARQPELAFAVVLDHKRVVRGDLDSRSLGTIYRPPGGLQPLLEKGTGTPAERLLGNRALLVAETPVFGPRGGIGSALIGLKRSYIESSLAAARRQQALVLALLVALGVVSSLVLMSQFLRPIGHLRAGIERIGRGELDRPIGLRDRTELGLLADSIDEMAGELRRAQAEMLERERLAHEVELARQIQRSLLPTGPVSAPPFHIEGDQRAAAEVGGDYYDILPLAGGRIGIAVGDVAGKGLAGCLVMSMLSALLRTLRDSCESPAALLATLDGRLGESLRPGTFVTLFYGVLDSAQGRLTYASAGHNPMLVYRAQADGVETLESKGIPLAALRGGAIRRTLRDASITLEPGDVLVQYTDGYTDAISDGGELFGLPRMERIVCEAAPRGGASVLEALRRSVREWAGEGTPSDDETLLVVSRDPAGSNLAEVSSPEDRSSSPASTPEAERALRELAEAEARGHALNLSSHFDPLDEITDWMEDTPVLRDLLGTERELLSSALYEVCANIVEHGGSPVRRGGDDLGSFDLWWIPAADRALPLDSAEASLELRAGRFVIRDDANPFRPQNWRATDFHDRGARTRGRGLGLDIIHRVMSEVIYEPATRRGNITILTFGPWEAHVPEEGIPR